MAGIFSYYLGIDGGGTNSRMLAVDRLGEVLGRYQGKSTNLASNSPEIVARHLRALVDAFLQESALPIENCRGFCIGSAGVDTPQSVSEMESILRGLQLKCPISVINDGELILWAELESKAGVALVSGTGSVAFGKNARGEVKRVGGWGHLFDDKGSSYWIGKEGLSRAFLSFDGRGRSSILNERFKKHFNVNTLDESIPPIYEQHADKTKIASLGIMVKEAAEAGDPVALEILQEAAADLFAHVSTLVDSLAMGDESIIVSASGGNIENNEIVREGLEKNIKKHYPKAIFRLAKQEPVFGAAYLARQLGEEEE